MVVVDAVVVVVVVDEGSGTLDDSGKGHKYETSGPAWSKHFSNSFNSWIFLSRMRSNVGLQSNCLRHTFWGNVGQNPSSSSSNEQMKMSPMFFPGCNFQTKTMWAKCENDNVHKESKNFVHDV